MSKTSNKQKYECLMPWLEWFKKQCKDVAKNKRYHAQESRQAHDKFDDTIL